jgi:hypothetical protein
VCLSYDVMAAIEELWELSEVEKKKDRAVEVK